MFCRVTRSFLGRTLFLAGVSAVSFSVTAWAASISVDKIATEQSPRQLSMALAADEKCNALSLEERNEMEGLLRQVEISFAEAKSFEESQVESAKGTRDGGKVACDTATKEAVRGMLISYRYAMLSTVPSMRGTEEQEMTDSAAANASAAAPETGIAATPLDMTDETESAIGEQALGEQPAVESTSETKIVAAAAVPEQPAQNEQVETPSVTAETKQSEDVAAEPKIVVAATVPAKPVEQATIAAEPTKAAEPAKAEEMQVASAEPATIEMPAAPPAKPIEFEVKAPESPVSVKVEPAVTTEAAVTPEIKQLEKPVVAAAAAEIEKPVEPVAEEAKAKIEEPVVAVAKPKVAEPVVMAKPKIEEPVAMAKPKVEEPVVMAKPKVEAPETKVAATQSSETVVQPAVKQPETKPVVDVVEPVKTQPAKSVKLAALVQDTKITEEQPRVTQKATRPVKADKIKSDKIKKSEKKLVAKKSGKSPAGLSAYGQMAENYYRELRCRSMSTAAVNSFYRKVVRTHRSSVSAYGVPAVAATLRSAERRAAGRSCG